MLAEPALASLPSLYSKLPIDVLRDFTPLGGIATAPQVVTVSNAVTGKGAQDLIAFARANPGKVNFGSPGRGTTGPKRHSLTPEIPTMAEQGLPGYQIMQWWGLVSPRGTPKPVVSTINAAIGWSLGTAEMKDRLATLFAEPWPSSPEAFGAFLKAEIESLGKIIRTAGIKAE